LKVSVPKSATLHSPTVVVHTKKENRSRKIKRKKEANAQIAHLVFTDTLANPKKPKELFFCQRSTENKYLAKKKF